jgi:S1-C subfamily serine protease
VEETVAAEKGEAREVAAMAVATGAEGKAAATGEVARVVGSDPGNSGGALVDASGKLIGINTAIATRTGAFSGYSFAIPINLAKRIADDIIEFGSYQRPFLGISISDLDSEYASELGVDLSQGVVVEELSDGGSAQYAGILPKDVITEVDNRSVKSVAELQEVVGRAKVGDTIDVTLYRKGKRLQIPVRLRKNSSAE